ncbi:MAG TPA: glycosidase [Candidatus Hydrogenedentes bacterium]|nr:glycosidase [Candidatus Hydrogenedentota bacterium]
MRPLFKRSEKNPIITSHDMPIAAAAVLNPGATIQGDEVVLLLRVESDAGFSDIHVARSKNGVDNWRIASEPILRHGQNRWRYERWGCEDARVTYLAEQNYWYITYTAYSSVGAAVAIARTKDLVRAERIGLIFSPNNKDAALFPQRFAGRWAVLHRPDAGGGKESIWAAYSPDLVHWGQPHLVLPEGDGPAWDGDKVGAGPPPILTKQGWLLIYHGVKIYGGELIYRAGAAMSNREKPHRLIARSKNCLFQAEYPYEMTGFVPNVVFPTGLLLRGDELWMYYGAADTCVCLATAKLSDVLGTLEEPEAYPLEPKA